MVGVDESASIIAAESSRNGFNITASSEPDVGYRHLFEIVKFWQEL
jgi:hypothetical protein